MMGTRLLAAAAVFLTVGLASPAHADPGSTPRRPDLDAFVATLKAHNIPMTDDEALEQGLAVCWFLDQPGSTLAGANDQLAKMHPEWTPEQAVDFSRVAADAWCPGKSTPE